MTVQQLLENTSSRELAEWMALYTVELEEADEQRDRNDLRSAVSDKLRDRAVKRRAGT